MLIFPTDLESADPLV